MTRSGKAGCRQWPLMLLPLLCSLLPSAAAQPAPEPGIITVAIPVSPNNLDPRFGTDENSARAQQLLFNDLLRWTSKRASPRPRCVLGHDRLSDLSRFDLREGVRFHDGHELTSEDVVYTFTSMLDPAFASPYRGAFRDLASVVAIDRYTVDFVLKQPSGSFLIEPRRSRSCRPARGASCANTPSAPGPYEFVSLCRRRSARGARLPRLLRRAAAKPRHRHEGRARRHHARPRAAEGDVRSRRQRSRARHGLSAREGRADARRSLPASTTSTSASICAIPF